MIAIILLIENLDQNPNAKFDNCRNILNKVTGVFAHVGFGTKHYKQ